MRKKLCVVALLVMVAAVFCSCGGPSTLEDYIKENETGQKMMSALEQKNEAIEVKASVEGNTLIVNGNYKENYTSKEMKAQFKKYFDQQVSKFAEVYTKMLNKLAEASGLDAKDLEVQLNYNNADGSQLWTHTFKVE